MLQESWYENEYNSNGKLTHVKCLNNQKEYWYEDWYEYDANEHLIHEKKSDGKEEFYEYDEKGNLTYCRESKEFGNKIIGAQNRAFYPRTHDTCCFNISARSGGKVSQRSNRKWRESSKMGDAGDLHRI